MVMARFFSVFSHGIPLLALYILTYSPVLAQEAIASDNAPVGEEAFRVILQAYEYDRDIPLDILIESSDETPECTREKIVFRGIHDSHVPGYLSIPKTGTPPYPCILILHGAGGSKSKLWNSDTQVTNQLNTQLHISGFATLSLDAQYHGERTPDNDSERWGQLYRRQLFHRMDEAIVQSVVEHRRGLDYLETRKDIDSQQIGMYGYSLGGMMTYFLTGVDQRIKVSVACVAPPKERMAYRREVVKPHNFVRAIGNRPFLIMMGRTDPFYTVEEARQFYERIESEAKEIVWYDSGHLLPMEHIGKAIEWFEEHLK